MPCFLCTGRLTASVVALLAAGALACAGEPREIVLASTTSTEDSGLFEALLPAFETDHPEYRVRAIAVGSGEALRLGSRGDADVLLVHSPAAERAFMAADHGESRRRVMFNDFVIVGPPADPAGVRGMTVATDALARIAAAGATFISRGDDSGTHSRERALWSAAVIEPVGDGYVESGLGMGEVLMMASELGAYTLSDRGTFLSRRDALALVVLVQGDPALRNQYSVIVVDDARNLEGARTFADWLTAPRAQRLIGEFGQDRFDRPLFTPNAGSG